MDEKVAIVKKEPAQEVGATSEFGGNNSSHPPRFERQRSVSGPNSPGEKSLLKKKPDWMRSPKTKIPVFNSCLCSLDEVVATPSFNVSVIEGACDKDFKFFDAINNSKYVAVIDGALAILGLFAVSIGVYVIKYCKLREIERNSHYFYFSRIFKTVSEEEIKNKMGEIEQDERTIGPITYEYLQAVAHFYPPDISKIACWRRRLFASGMEGQRLKALNKFLKENPKILKQEILDMLHKKILVQVCQLINPEGKIEKFQIKGKENNWTIGLTDKYAKIFFNHIETLIKKNSSKILEKNKNRKNKNFIPPILAALGQASFIYWILMFIFYFIPIAPVVTVAAISVIPLGIALLVALPSLLIFKIINTYRTFNTNKGMEAHTIETQHKQMIEKKLVKLNKQKIFLDCMRNKNVESSVRLKDSSLMKDLKKVIKNRHFIKYYAICMGFLDGCFLPLFVGWLFLDGTKVILTYALCPAVVPFASFTPIGLIATAIIVGVTLLIGVSYGIYSAYKANQAHEAKFDVLKFKIDALEKEVPNKEILNMSLRDYDRLLRRFTDELPIWTSCKKVLNRFVVIIKRLGTGSLVFRLVMWGPITAVYAAVIASTAVPAFFPIILIIGTAIGAFVLASFYSYAYNLESKTIRAGNIVEHLVQSEQLTWIDEQLPIPISEKCLNLHDSSSEQIFLTSENLAESENDQCISPEFSQQNVSTAVQSTKVDAETIQAETTMQRNTSNASSGLFKNTQDRGTGDENMECLSTAVFSC
ncbi:hypothetical protein [Rickettsiella endosymbiont of Miltochrista miniata]|uniref:hypothetical protein n=1 Tax=Rickettsiella endosymbiont of Miltochrista miniata TaxID=3066239 RepID=UPI00313EAC35